MFYSSLLRAIIASNIVIDVDLLLQSIIVVPVRGRGNLAEAHIFISVSNCAKYGFRAVM